MPLGEAVEHVGKIERQYRLNPVDRTLAARLIGYKTLSGPANKALADLAAYGLVERAGKGELRVSTRARDILHAENQRERNMRLMEAALEPDLYRELRDRFVGIPVPPEEGVVTYLNRQGFNPNAVRPAAKAFLGTINYLQEIGATDSHGVNASTAQESENKSGSDTKYGGAAVGDLVQWENNGALALPEVRRVRAISEDGNWVFVEQSETGIPMSEVIVEEKAKPEVRQPPMLALPEAPPAKGTRKEVFALDEGDVVLTFPDNLSSTSFADLEAYLKVFVGKMRRRSGVKEEGGG
jgi:hypothetical protein